VQRGHGGTFGSGSVYEKRTVQQRLESSKLACIAEGKTVSRALNNAERQAELKIGRRSEILAED
jgi:hypothetical protein